MTPTELQYGTVKHFKLSRDPFRGEMGEADAFWTCPAYKSLEARLLNALELPAIACLVGPVGSGKTQMKRSLLRRLQAAKTFRTAAWKVFQAKAFTKKRMTPSAVATLLLHGLTGESFYGDIEKASLQIEKRLEEIGAGGTRCVLIIDDAHELPTDIIRASKKIYELAQDCGAHLAILLIGHSHLATRLKESEIGELDEIYRRCEAADMPPIRRYISQYIDAKLQRAGRPVGEIFHDAALDAIKKMKEAEYPIGLNRIAAAAMNVAAHLDATIVKAEMVTGTFELKPDAEAAERLVA